VSEGDRRDDDAASGAGLRSTARDVSARATQYLVREAERRGVERARIVEGTCYSFEAFTDPKVWLPWSAYERMIDNIGDALGEAALLELAQSVVDWPLFRPFWIAWLLPSTHQLLRWFARYTIGPAGTLFPTSTVKVEPTGEGSYRVDFRAPPGGGIPRTWELLAISVAEEIPRLLGRSRERARSHRPGPGELVLEVRQPATKQRLRKRLLQGLAALKLAPAEVASLMDDLVERNLELAALLEERDRQRREREQLERELERAQRLEALGRYAGGVAHDFNNLLAVISTSSELLSRKLPRDDPRQEEVRAIQAATTRGARLVRQLLSFGSRGSRPTEVVDLVDVIERLRPVLERSVRAPARLSIELPTSRHAWIVGDEAQLEQLVLNLVLNARDAVEAGGQVELELAILEHGETATAEARAQGVELSVRDDGVGMDEATRSRAFEPFFTTKQARGGSGIGLATVQAVVERHAGSIELESSPGRGTTIRTRFAPAF
jgi:signal transduction histidine kinase